MGEPQMQLSSLSMLPLVGCCAGKPNYAIIFCDMLHTELASSTLLPDHSPSMRTVLLLDRDDPP